MLPDTSAAWAAARAARARAEGPWRGINDVEFETMSYVDWFNQRRLHREITDDTTYTTPAEFEAAYYRQMQPVLEAVTQEPEQSRKPERFNPCHRSKLTGVVLCGGTVNPPPR